MHPDGVQEYDIERNSEPVHIFQPREAVVDPPNLICPVQTHSTDPHCSDGSTAITSWPREASQAASRPEPAPTSKIRAGWLGRMLASQAFTFSGASGS